MNATANKPTTNARVLSDKGIRKRSEILNVASKMLKHQGYEKFAMRQVARECDIDLKNLQYYFPTKENLLVGIVQQSFEQTIEATLKVVETPRDPSQKVPEIINVLLGLWNIQVTAIWFQMFAMAPYAVQLMAIKEEMYERFYAILSDILARDFPNASPENIHSTARVLNALVDGASVARTPSRRKSLSFTRLQEDIRRASKIIIESELLVGTTG